MIGSPTFASPPSSTRSSTTVPLSSASSVLESFSYPPLEMIATGGHAVVLSNEGNATYLVDQQNCLLFEGGEDDKAARLIEQIASDEALRARLLEGGLKTARALSWDSIRQDILDLYR